MNMQRLTDEEYKFVFERVPRLCLDFVVVKDEKFLLMKRDIEPFLGSWSLPGGMIRRGEAVEEASKRILESEIGSTFESLQMLGYCDCGFETNQNGISVHSISIVFLTTLQNYNLKGSFQAKKLDFFSELPDNMQKTHKDFIIKNLEKIHGK
jgi:8-oxo-dGTP diphosphatase